MKNSKPLHIGIVGCGEVTKDKHIPALLRLPEARLLAVADSRVQRAQELATRFNIPNAYSSLKELLDSADLDAIGICVPPQSHVDLAVDAVASGKHILIEKPLALTIEDCERLIQHVKDRSQKVMVGFHMRWHNLVRRARTIIQTGKLGKIEFVRSVWYSPKGFFDLPPWRRRRESGGGALIEIGVHHFDLWRYLLRTEIKELYCFSKDDQWQDESAVVSAQTVDGVLISGVFSERSCHEIQIEISGRNGRLMVFCQQFEGLRYYSVEDAPGKISTRAKQFAHTIKELPRGISNMRYGGDYADSYKNEWRHFIDAIKNNRPVGCTLEDGRQALKIALTAVESAKIKRSIRFN